MDSKSNCWSFVIVYAYEFECKITQTIKFMKLWKVAPNFRNWYLIMQVASLQYYKYIVFWINFLLFLWFDCIGVWRNEFASLCTCNSLKEYYQVLEADVWWSNYRMFWWVILSPGFSGKLFPDYSKYPWLNNSKVIFIFWLKYGSYSKLWNLLFDWWRQCAI